MTLPPGQSRVLAAFDAYVATHGYAPSERELAEALGCSKTLAHKQLVALVHKGILLGTYATPRSLRRAPSGDHTVPVTTRSP